MKMSRQKSRVYFFLSLFLGFSLLWIHCNQEKAPETSPEFNLKDPQKRNDTILKVEGSSYLNSDFEAYIRTIVGEDQEDLSIPLLSRLFDRFIEEKILLQAAKNQEISLTWEEKKDYLTKLGSEFLDEEKGTLLETLDTQLLFDKLLIAKYTYLLVEGIEVTEEEIKEYYDLNKREFLSPERIKVSQILVRTEAKAIEVLNMVKDSSEEEFRQTAQLYSVSTDASKGGDMGWFEMGQLPYEMERIIFALKDGELSQVMESSYGYHIFRVDKRQGPELISSENASEAIKLKLLDQRIKLATQQHLETLKANLDWVSYPQKLPFPYSRKES
jgi:parvulin-like peptidyl-prolyl isomerase